MRKTGLLIVIFSLFASLSLAQDPTGRQIFEEHRDRHSISNVLDHVVMLLIDKNGNRKIRSLKRYNKKFEDGLKRSMIVFLEPGDLKGTTLLTRQLAENEYKQWIYLPGRNAMQRIASRSQRSAFMGSDFTYEDLQPDLLDNYNFSTPESETIEGKDCFVIVMTPKNKKNTSYGKRIFWIRKDIYFTMKIEFFDHHKRLIKTQTNHELTTEGNGVWYAKKVLMDNHKKKHKTLMGLKERHENKEIDNTFFTQKNILKGMHME